VITLWSILGSLDCVEEVLLTITFGAWKVECKASMRLVVYDYDGEVDPSRAREDTLNLEMIGFFIK